MDAEIEILVGPGKECFLGTDLLNPHRLEIDFRTRTVRLMIDMQCSIGLVADFAKTKRLGGTTRLWQQRLLISCRTAAKSKEAQKNHRQYEKRGHESAGPNVKGDSINRSIDAGVAFQKYDLECSALVQMFFRGLAVIDLVFDCECVVSSTFPTISGVGANGIDSRVYVQELIRLVSTFNFAGEPHA